MKTLVLDDPILVGGKKILEVVIKPPTTRQILMLKNAKNDSDECIIKCAILLNVKPSDIRKMEFASLRRTMKFIEKSNGN